MEALAETDESLMRRYAAGDAPAFVRLYDRHERPVHRFFVRQGVATATADDLLQETWMAVVRSAPRYAVEAKFTTWLYRIAHSKLVDHWRATKHRALFDDAVNDPDQRAHERADDGDPLDVLAASDAVRPDVQAMSRQQARAFVDAVEALPTPQRTTFLLHVEGELTLEEMAAATDVGVETAKSRLRYAMRRMRAACADWLAPPLAVASGTEGRDDA